MTRHNSLKQNNNNLSNSLVNANNTGDNGFVDRKFLMCLSKLLPAGILTPCSLTTSSCQNSRLPQMQPKIALAANCVYSCYFSVLPRIALFLCG